LNVRCRKSGRRRRKAQRSGATETQWRPSQFGGGARNLQQLAGDPPRHQAPEQDGELIERTQALDELKIIERKALADVERSSRSCSMPNRPKARAQRELQELQECRLGQKLKVELRQIRNCASLATGWR
jgi:hypothetical protein